jgi:NADH-quinone oxidoreductase subunit A
MPAAYIPVLIFALLVLSFPVVTLLVFKLIRPESRGGPAKFQPYECGIPAESNARGRYSARFYVVAMLFVIFNVETVFLFPWAILYRSRLAAHAGGYALISMFVFVGILLVGYIWLYKKGALDWAWSLEFPTEKQKDFPRRSVPAH